MKLLAFVLLGFLAHSCSGNFQWNNACFEQYACSILNNHFAENEGAFLPEFDLSTITGIVTSVTGLASLQIGITYDSVNEYYALGIQGGVNLPSSSFTGLSLNVNVFGQLALSAADGCLSFDMIEGSLEIDLQVANTAVSIASGGVLGGVLGLVNSFTSTSKLLFQEKLQEMLGCSLDLLNLDLQGITTPVNQYGASLSYQVTEIKQTANSLSVCLDATIQRAADTTTKTYSLTTADNELGEGLLAAISFTTDYIGGIFECVLDEVVPSYWTSVPNTQWKLYNMFTAIQGAVSVSVTKASSPSCVIDPSGNFISFQVTVCFFDDDEGAQFLAIDADIQAAFAIGNKFELFLSQPTITNKDINTKGDGCSCTDQYIIDSINDLLTSCVLGLVVNLQSVLKSGILFTDTLPPFLPLVSGCSSSVADVSHHLSFKVTLFCHSFGPGSHVRHNR